ncbi:MAG: hypothetical protein KDC87_05160 [Planctomycetes bacterium]|nr:hypothetical protein [Planctomycetota bacterium]
MRQGLIDHARRRRADKRGGDRKRQTLLNVAGQAAKLAALLDVEAALAQLQATLP